MCTPGTRGRRAPTPTSSSWRGGPVARGSRCSAPGTSPTRFASASCSRGWCRPSLACSGSGTSWTGPWSSGFRLCRGPLRFLLTVEVSTAFRRDGRARRMHHLLYVPELETAATLSDHAWGAAGTSPRTAGRPLPWTRATCSRPHSRAVTALPGAGARVDPVGRGPERHRGVRLHRGLLRGAGAALFAVETGLSADPPMDWRHVAARPDFRLVSYSDAHAPSRLGRRRRSSRPSWTTSRSAAPWRPATGLRGRLSSLSTAAPPERAPALRRPP